MKSSGTKSRMGLVATCALGLEDFLAAELRELGMEEVALSKGAVSFRGGWQEVYRANWRLRTANRVLVSLGSWPGGDGEALSRGARKLVAKGPRDLAGVGAGRLFDPERTFAIKASSSASRVTDVRWVALKIKDGICDAQRMRYGRRASIDRQTPDLPLRVWLHQDRATLLLDTSGEPLDRRGYRSRTVKAPVREQLAAACILASGWRGEGPVVDPMCGSGTLLAEAGWIATGRAPGVLRAERPEGWSFQRFPGFDRRAFDGVLREEIAKAEEAPRLIGIDRDPGAIAAARRNLECAGLLENARLYRDDAFDIQPPPGPGLLVINPAYGERLEETPQQWKRLGDLLKQRFAGWRAVVLAGGPSRGKWIGLRPERRIPVRNGPLDARILLFNLY